MVDSVDLALGARAPRHIICLGALAPVIYYLHKILVISIVHLVVPANGAIYYVVDGPSYKTVPLRIIFGPGY